MSREMISKYERGLAIPSVDAAKKIADAFSVSLDYLVGEGINATFDKKTLKRLQEIENMRPDFRIHLFSVIDSVIRDYKNATSVFILKTINYEGAIRYKRQLRQSI